MIKSLTFKFYLSVGLFLISQIVHRITEFFKFHFSLRLYP
ncbi:hypothetical protein HMPREF9099_02973 [Lachnospiraceae bacterium oral taxon 082 str. F0431]|nr:hypothetical protein HMPREF9099_02973 [Lachnospiraceae bacterium oral taxon 082 str. F0431]